MKKLEVNIRQKCKSSQFEFKEIWRKYASLHFILPPLDLFCTRYFYHHNFSVCPLVFSDVLMLPVLLDNTMELAWYTEEYVGWFLCLIEIELNILHVIVITVLQAESTPPPPNKAYCFCLCKYMYICTSSQELTFYFSSVTHFPSSSVIAGAVPAFLISSSSFCFRQSSRDFFLGSSCSSDLVFLETTEGGRLIENDMVDGLVLLEPFSKSKGYCSNVKTSFISCRNNSVDYH